MTANDLARGGISKLEFEVCDESVVLSLLPNAISSVLTATPANIL